MGQASLFMQKHTVLVASAACRFWHVTGLVLDMMAQCLAVAEPRMCHPQWIMLFRDTLRNQQTDGQLFQIKVYVLRQSVRLIYKSRVPASRVYTLRPTTKDMGIISHQNNSPPTGFLSWKSIRQHHHLSPLYTFHPFSFASLQFHEYAQQPLGKIVSFRLQSVGLHAVDSLMILHEFVHRSNQDV